ncbi:MAG: hypothetical protein GY801_26915 [bacterium]|nr:hypothetical protein [bacterium]
MLFLTFSGIRTYGTIDETIESYLNMAGMSRVESEKELAQGYIIWF